MWKYLIQIAYNKLLISSPGKLVVQLFQLGLLFSGCTLLNWLGKGKETFELQSVEPTRLCLLRNRITLDVQSTGKKEN